MAPKTSALTWVARWFWCRAIRIPFAAVKKAHNQAAAQGIPMDWKMLTNHFLAGGDLTSLVEGMAYAKSRGATLRPDGACVRQLYAQSKYQLSLKQYLEPFIEKGIKDLDKASL